jgi:NADPH-dependent glutamate synthase beta subunit-like oxidoreductase/ferredoxin
MIKIKINNRELQVEKGTSVIRAAESLGIKIPTLCLNEELGHITSCMLCLVKDTHTGKLFPSCSVTAVEGMSIITDNDEIKEARQTALELLLSEHIGDCEAPCQIACPAHMNIPQMNRLIGAGYFYDALVEVKKNIALPAVLGRICPAPCEGACHRKSIDSPVSICLLKQFVGDENDLHPFDPYPSIGKTAAVIGAGPAGLAAAYYLQLKGVQVTLYDKNSKSGGMLRSAIGDDVLPKEILDKEIETILNTGVKFEGGKFIQMEDFQPIRNQFDAIVISTGVISDEMKNWGISLNGKGIEADKNSYQTSQKGVFAIGNSLRSSKLAIRSLGQGKEVASSVLQYLSGKEPKGEPQLFNSKFGRLFREELTEYLKESVDRKRMTPINGGTTGFTKEEVILEAQRCLHCDCREIENCKLRFYATEYGADQKHFAGNERKVISKKFAHDVVYEPQKCIKCGICVGLTEKYNEKFGFTFIGRGFDVEIGVPFNESIEAGLAETAKKVANACPTGALSANRKL